MANIPGTQAANTLTGTSSADSIVGFEGNDIINAGGGNDSVWAGQGNDSVQAGNGNDLVYGDLDKVSTWGYRVYNRDFSSSNNQAFTIESGTLAGSGLSTGFDVTAHANAARGTSGDPNDFGIIYTSTFTATTAGTYTFRTTSDDGSTIRLLDGSGTPLTWTAQSTGQTGLTYLNNDFHQGATTRQASVTLAAGQTYTIEIRFWENRGANTLTADFRLPGSTTWNSLTNNTSHIGTGVYAGNDTLDGGAGDDTLHGEAGDDSILGGAGNDLIYGGAGADTVLFGSGNDTVYGGDGNDLIDDVFGGQENGANQIFGGAGNDSVWAGNDNDTVQGEAGDDVLNGEAGDDQLFGGDGNDVLAGGAGNDLLDGGQGADVMDGGDGNDTLIGGIGNDQMAGGLGTDRFILDDNHGADTITGGENAGDLDVVDATAVAGNLTVTVSGLETGTISGAGLTTDFNQIERLELGSGNDTVTVASGSDAIELDGGVGIDNLTINGTPVQRSAVTLTNTATGTFTPANGGPVVNFGPTQPMTLADVLATYKNGAINIAGATPLSGQAGNVTFDNFENLNFNIICFVRGTRIATPCGEVAVEDLHPGDLVCTLDQGNQPLRWVGSARRAATGRLAPVRIAAGALGNTRDLLVSQQHRMMLRGWQASLMFGEEEVLVAAKALVNDHSIRVEEGGMVEYFHLLFDQHQIIFAEGAPSESFHPGQQGWKALDRAAREEILALFPELEARNFATFGATARQSLKDYEGQVLARALLAAT